MAEHLPSSDALLGVECEGPNQQVHAVRANGAELIHVEVLAADGVLRGDGVLG